MSNRTTGAALALTLALAAGSGLVTAAPVSAFSYNPINTATDVELRVNFSGKCLEVADWRTDDGAPIREWTCTGGANQKWRFTNGFAVNVNSGKCLEIPGFSTAPAAQADQWTCNGGSNQRWGAVNVSQDGLAVVNFNSDLVLDVNGANPADGTAVIQWYPTGVPNQRWTLAG